MEDHLNFARLYETVSNPIYDFPRFLSNSANRHWFPHNQVVFPDPQFFGIFSPLERIRKGFKKIIRHNSFNTTYLHYNSSLIKAANSQIVSATDSIVSYTYFFNKHAAGLQVLQYSKSRDQDHGSEGKTPAEELRPSGIRLVLVRDPLPLNKLGNDNNLQLSILISFVSLNNSSLVVFTSSKIHVS